jgi:hypothetical protein
MFGCNPAVIGESLEIATETAIPTATMPVGTPEPLCPRNSTYRVGFADLNTPISQCQLYFYAHFIIEDTNEKYFQIIIQPNRPIGFHENGLVDYSTVNQITPYWYRWVIKDSNGQVEQAWLAYFLENRDGLYHTIISQSEQDWQNSFLEIFIEDVNNDHVREDVTFEIAVGEIPKEREP